MGHLATGPTELREAVGQGALEKESSDMGGEGHPLLKGQRQASGHISYSVCLLLKGKSAGSED